MRKRLEKGPEALTESQKWNRNQRKPSSMDLHVKYLHFDKKKASCVSWTRRFTTLSSASIQ